MGEKPQVSKCVLGKEAQYEQEKVTDQDKSSKFSTFCRQIIGTNMI